MGRCLNEKHYVGETGTVIYINCGVDVSAATDISVIITRPDGTDIQRSATVEEFEGSDHYVKFIIEEGDFNQGGTYPGDPLGDYVGQVKLTLGGWTGKGREFHIEVEEGLSSSSSSSS
jgi:hypothetical protein